MEITFQTEQSVRIIVDGLISGVPARRSSTVVAIIYEFLKFYCLSPSRQAQGKHLLFYFLPSFTLMAKTCMYAYILYIHYTASAYFILITVK